MRSTRASLAYDHVVKPIGPYRCDNDDPEDDPSGLSAGGPCPQIGEPGRWEFPLYDMGPGDYAIWLPHQCDEWIVACGSKEHVLAKARDFLASVKAAIEALEAD